MADLTTSYLGLSLPSPLVLASSSLSNRVENFQLAEESGAGAVVLRSLFEEQIEAAESALQEALSQGEGLGAESTRSFFPSQRIGPVEYLQLVSRAKRAVRIPVIGSVNCVAAGSWSAYARQVVEAGADAPRPRLEQAGEGTHDRRRPVLPAVDGVEAHRQRLHERELREPEPRWGHDLRPGKGDELRHRAVALHPERLVAAAGVGPPAAARGAVAAARVGHDGHRRSRPDAPRRALARPHDLRGDLVAWDAGVAHQRIAAEEGREVGAAEADLAHAEQDLARPRLRLRPFDDPRAARIEDAEGLHRR